jgi:hypothetical protein
MKAETSSLKLLLLPLVPALAFGIFEVASHISVPAPIAAHEAPDPAPDPESCINCEMTA